MSLSAALAFLLAAGPGAGPTLEARFLGNAAFEIRDGQTTLLTDFPYQSGAFDYMEYDPAELSARPGSLCLITHAHADHFDAKLAARVGCRVIGPPSPGAETADLPAGLGITPVPTAHAGVSHFSYLVAWKGRRLYFTGDTESTAQLARVGTLDALFITPWLLAAARAADALPKAAQIVVYHHKTGEKIPGCRGCVVPRQGQVIEIPARAGSEAS